MSKRKLVSYDEKFITKKTKIHERLERFNESMLIIEQSDTKNFHDKFLKFLKGAAESSISLVFDPKLSPRRLQRNMALFVRQIKSINFSGIKEFYENKEDVFYIGCITMDNGETIILNLDEDNELNNYTDELDIIIHGSGSDNDIVLENYEVKDVLHYFVNNIADFVVDFLVNEKIFDNNFFYRAEKIRVELDKQMNGEKIMRVFPDSILFAFVYHMKIKIWGIKLHPNLLL